jgi:hypothetical protein
MSYTGDYTLADFGAFEYACQRMGPVTKGGYASAAGTDWDHSYQCDGAISIRLTETGAQITYIGGGASKTIDISTNVYVSTVGDDYRFGCAVYNNNHGYEDLVYLRTGQASPRVRRVTGPINPKNAPQGAHKQTPKNNPGKRHKHVT